MDERGTAAIADALGAGYVYRCVGPHRFNDREFGNAIVSRWPMRDGVFVPLPGTATIAGQPRSATRALVSVEGADVLAYSVHTETPAMRLSRRVGQFSRIAEDVVATANERVVVGGDFNTVTPRGLAALRAAMAPAGLRPASVAAGPTFHGSAGSLRLDHVFVRGLEPLRAGVVSGTTASDHLPLWVDAAPPAREA
jgi:endonuclease/exonuclease/phosphatase family metal-dependent hydrolase